MIVRPPRSDSLWFLWGEALVATASNAPSAAGVERFLVRVFKGRGGAEIMVKPYWFDGFVRGQQSIVGCLGAVQPLVYVGQHEISVAQLFDEIERLGLWLDLCWDPHWDPHGGGPQDYHRDPAQAPHDQRYLFPYSSQSERMDDADLCRDVCEAIAVRWPGILRRITASNEPYYQPRWSVAHTPQDYGDWVREMFTALNRLPFAAELVATGQVGFGDFWWSGLLDRVTVGIHELFAPVPAGTPDNLIPDFVTASLKRTYDAVTRRMREQGHDFHAARYASDEWLPSGRIRRPGGQLVGTDTDVAVAVHRAGNLWHDQYKLSRSVLGVGGISPIFEPNWNITWALVYPDGRWTLAAYEWDRLYGSGGTPPLDPTPPSTVQENEVTKEQGAELARILAEGCRLDRRHAAGEISGSNYVRRKEELEREASELRTDISRS